jgi:epoxyqueuosine reductase
MGQGRAPDLDRLRTLAAACGFELAGAAPAGPPAEAAWDHEWAGRGFAGEMRYLTDRRAHVRDDPRNLLPSARTVICAGKVYNGPEPYSTRFSHPELAWISRYAWGDDYHVLLRRGLEELRDALAAEMEAGFESRICVDTAPLLERAYARAAGLGWIGKNGCLINQQLGSWFFLGELLVSFEMECGAPPPVRCGTCTRCIDACPTAAFAPAGGPGEPAWALDARRCISYFTIELRGSVAEEVRAGAGANVFGCDICQDVCPWNRRAALTTEPGFAPHTFAPPLEEMAAISAPEFARMFGATPVARARYSGFLRNVAVAMGASGLARFRAPLEALAASPDALVAEHALWALQQLP